MFPGKLANSLIAVANLSRLLFSLCLWSTLVNSQANNLPPRHNFILIMCDNLGYGDIEPFGSKLHRTPNLNRMAKEGRKLTSF